ncbi:MAG: phenylphosphate carboxylase subunit delta [Planctomycetota bacterium]|nr:MAG: phenylphosphate carboxylase subunit delta [Planctomycetota bacterium]
MLEKIKQIKLVVFDSDGVLTDGRVVVNSDGTQSRFFHIHDGGGIYLLKHCQFHLGIISGKCTDALSLRAAELGVEFVYQGVLEKVEAMEEILQKTNLTWQEACYVGDDLIDIPVLTQVGFPVAVANAREEVKQASAYITKCPGGQGAVREVAELILKTQGKYEAILRKLYQPKHKSPSLQKKTT